MIRTNPLFISTKGGSITCFIGDSGRVFRSCSGAHCLYSSDLHSAKAYLDSLESRNNVLIAQPSKFSAQRKTTLKWNSDGELSAVDMARILDRLANPQLTSCELACDLKDYSSNNWDDSYWMRLPLSSWLP